MPPHMLRQLRLVVKAPPWPAAPEQLQVALPGRRGAIHTIGPTAVAVAELSPSLKRAQQQQAGQATGTGR